MSVILEQRGMIAAELEAAKGVAETPVAADAGIEVFDISLEPTIEVARRDSIEASFDTRENITGNENYTLTFRVPMKGGGAPLATLSEVTKLLQACGLTETITPVTSVAYDPESDNAVNQTITIDVYEDGKRKRVHGAMGNVKWIIEQNAVPHMEFTYMGLYNAATDTALLTGITYGAVNPPRPVNMTCTWAGFTFRMTKVEFDLGNEVQLRPDICSAGGFVHAFIANRQPTASVDPEEELVATVDWVEQLRLATAGALSIVIGSVAGNVWTFTMPNAQVVDATPGERVGLKIKNLTLEARANSDAGDDSFQLLLE